MPLLFLSLISLLSSIPSYGEFDAEIFSGWRDSEPLDSSYKSKMSGKEMGCRGHFAILPAVDVGGHGEYVAYTVSTDEHGFGHLSGFEVGPELRLRWSGNIVIPYVKMGLGFGRYVGSAIYQNEFSTSYFRNEIKTNLTEMGIGLQWAVLPLFHIFSEYQVGAGVSEIQEQEQFSQGETELDFLPKNLFSEKHKNERNTYSFDSLIFGIKAEF